MMIGVDGDEGSLKLDFLINAGMIGKIPLMESARFFDNQLVVTPLTSRLVGVT